MSEPGIINIPRDLIIHLRPDCFVYDIQLTSSKIRILTERNVEEYSYPAKVDPQEYRDIQNRKLTADRLTTKEQKQPQEIPVKLKHKEEIEKAFMTGHLEMGEMKGNCLIHADAGAKCTQDTCKCPPLLEPSTEVEKDTEKERKFTHKCCIERACLCCQKRLSDKGGNITDKQWDYNNMALDIIQFFEDNPTKLKILEQKVDIIIPACSKVVNMDQKQSKNLIEALKRHVPHAGNKLKLRKLTKKEIYNILSEVEQSLGDVPEKEDDDVSTANLNDVVTSLNAFIIDNKGDKIPSDLILELRTKLLNTKLSATEMKEVLNRITEKVKNNKFLLEDKKPISELHQTIINEINKNLDVVDGYKKCCNKCGQKRRPSQGKTVGEEIFKCKNPECGQKGTVDANKSGKMRRRSSGDEEAFFSKSITQKPIEIFEEDVIKSQKPNIYDVNYNVN